MDGTPEEGFVGPRWKVDEAGCYLRGPDLPFGGFVLSRLISAFSRYSPGGRPLIVSDESEEEDEPEQPPRGSRAERSNTGISERGAIPDTTQ
jgi:hypothetical protein